MQRLSASLLISIAIDRSTGDVEMANPLKISNLCVLAFLLLQICQQEWTRPVAVGSLRREMTGTTPF